MGEDMSEKCGEEDLFCGNKRGMQDVMWALLYGDGETRTQAAREIRRLTKNSEKSRAYLAAGGVIAPLVSMLQSDDAEAQEAALLALLNLAVRNERNKVKIVKAGIIPILVNFMQSENTSLRESAAAVILTLSAAASNKVIIGSSGATPLLVEMLTSGSTQGKIDAVMALYNLSTCPENLLHILVAGAIPPLTMLLKTCKKSSRYAEKITALLESLSAFEEGRTAIAREEGGILALVEAIEDGSQQSKEHAVGALLTMCQSSRCKYREAILKEGVIPGLLTLTVHGTPKAQQRAQSLLQLLRESPPSPRSNSASAMIESIVYDIAAHVDGVEKGNETARRMLSEMVQRSMERSMRQLQQRALVCMPTDMSRSKRLGKLPSEDTITH
uniref:U-box domain-containing protein n=1 Tax=Araucaria cunninghamii TaxID=56994 RepID=A0A0D6R9K0_ARACU